MAWTRPKPVECPHNEGVMCAHTADCENCGWNPEVEARRIAEIREKYGIEGDE